MRNNALAWLMAGCLGIASVVVLKTFGQTPVTPPGVGEVPLPQFIVQDQSRWSCILKGGDPYGGKLPDEIQCTHSKTSEVVRYLPVRPAPPVEKKEVKK